MVTGEPTGDTLILRDHLAIERTSLANERTLLAYLRTAIMLLISGATLIKLFAGTALLVITGYVLLPAGVVMALWGFGRFTRTRRSLSSEGPTGPNGLESPVSSSPPARAKGSDVSQIHRVP